MATPDKELPEDKQLVNDLYDFLKGGGKLKELFSSPSTDPLVDSIFPNEKIASISGLDHYKEMFFSGLSVKKIKQVGQRHVAEEIRNYFPNWRELMIENLSKQHPMVDALKGLTLKDLAEYADQQCKRWQKEVGRAVLGSKEHGEARAKSDYWEVIKEVMGPASDPDKIY